MMLPHLDVVVCWSSSAKGLGGEIWIVLKNGVEAKRRILGMTPSGFDDSQMLLQGQLRSGFALCIPNMDLRCANDCRNMPTDGVELWPDLYQM